MKRNSAGTMPVVTTLFWGVLALVLRRQLYLTGVDARNLLVQNHALGIALTVLTIGVLIRIILLVRKREDDRCYEKLYGGKLPGALGSLAAGSGILLTVLNTVPETAGYLQAAWHWLGLAAPVCLVLAGIARMLGKKPFFLLHVVVCLFFVMHIVTRYQLWSSQPQMQDYLFSLLGAMGLMFFSFYTAALEADCGSNPMMLGMGLGAVYFCAAELARSSCPWIYLGGIVWVVLDVGSMGRIEKA